MLWLNFYLPLPKLKEDTVKTLSARVFRETVGSLQNYSYYRNRNLKIFRTVNADF